MNHITIELCAEDRARLDRLTAALEARIAQAQLCIEKAYDKPAEQDDIAELARAVVNRKANTEEAPKNATEATEANTHPVSDPFPETSAQTEEPSVAPIEEAKPSVTLDQVKRKAIELATQGKKDRVREVVTSYAPKVSDLPEKVWDEVYKKLSALEG